MKKNAKQQDLLRTTLHDSPFFWGQNPPNGLQGFPCHSLLYLFDCPSNFSNSCSPFPPPRPPPYRALIVFLFPWSIWTRYVISWTYYFYCYSPSPYYKLHEGRAFFLSVLLTAITPASTTVHDPSILVKWTDIINTNPFKTYKRVPWDWLLGDTVVEYLKSQLYPCGTSNTQPLRCGGEDTSLNSR